MSRYRRTATTLALTRTGLFIIGILMMSRAIAQPHLVPFSSNGKWGFTDSAGTVVIQPEFIHTPQFTEGYAYVEKAEWKNGVEGEIDAVSDRGYLSTEGKFRSLTTITSRIDAGQPFHEGLAGVRNAGFGVFTQSKWGFIDSSFHMAIAPSYASVGDFSGGLAWAETRVMALFIVVSDTYGYIDRNGREVIKSQFDGAGNFLEELADVKLGNSWGYVNTRGEMVIAPRFEKAGHFSEGLAPVRLNGKWGYVNRKDSLAIAPQFFNARAFSEGRALVQLGPKWGFIDSTGSVVIAARFEDVSMFSEGLAAARIGDKWGFIDRNGTTVIPPTFDAAYGFSQGRALVIVAGKQTYIDRQGNPKWSQPK